MGTANVKSVFLAWYKEIRGVSYFGGGRMPADHIVFVNHIGR